MKNELTIQDKLTEFLLYSNGNDDVRVETYLHNETLWLPQKRIAELFNVDRSVISKHLKNIFDSQELNKELVCAKFAHTTQHGAIKEKTQNISLEYYNLDAILSVGYRVNSRQATYFRQWATKTLKEYIIKGFTIGHPQKPKPQNSPFLTTKTP